MKKTVKKAANAKTTAKTKRRFNDKLPEILPPRHDIVFKLVFAMCPELLKQLLKSLLGLPAGDFGKVVVVDPHVYPDRADGKVGVLDIKVTLRSKKRVNVEMQSKKIAHLRERVLFYCSGMVKEQVVSGDDYDKIKRVVSITITNHVVIPGDGEYHHRYTLYDPETRSEFTDLLEVHILELSKLPKRDDGSDVWKWMKFLTVNTKEELAMLAEKSPALKKAADRLSEVSENAQVRARLASIELYEMDQRVMMREAVEEGVQKGVARMFSLLEKGYSPVEAKKLAITGKDEDA